MNDPRKDGEFLFFNYHLNSSVWWQNLTKNGLLARKECRAIIFILCSSQAIICVGSGTKSTWVGIGRARKASQSGMNWMDRREYVSVLFIVEKLLS